MMVWFDFFSGQLSALNDKLNDFVMTIASPLIILDEMR